MVHACACMVVMNACLFRSTYALRVPTFMLLRPDGSEVARIGRELEECTSTEEVEKVLAGFFAAHNIK